MMSWDHKKRFPESEGLYQSLVNLSPDAILVHSDNKFVFANPAAVKILSARSPEEIVGKDVMELVHPDYHPLVAERTKQVYLGSVTPPMEIKLIRLDGVGIDAETRGARVEFGGKPAAQIVMRDITERKLAECKINQLNILRKQAEEALRESQAMFDAFMDSNPAIAWMKDESGRQVYMNKTWEKEYGLKKEDYLGTTKFVDQLPREAAGKLIEIDREVLRSGKPVEVIEMIGTGLTGGIRYWQTIKFPFWSASGQKFTGGVAIDITEYKRAEEALRESEERFRSVLENSLDGAYRRDLRSDKYDYLSPVIETITGYPAEVMNSMTLVEVFTFFHPQDRDAAMERFKEALQTGKLMVEYRYKCKDGQYRWLGDYATVLTDESGCPIYLSGVIRDITERKRAEGLLKEQEERFRAFMNNTTTKAWMKDELGRYVYLNKNFEKYYNLPTEDWLGKTDFEIWPEEFAEVLWKNDQEVLHAGHPIEFEEDTLILKDDRRTWWSFKFPFQDALGRKYIGGVGIDITERKRTEEALHRSEQNYRSLAEELREIDNHKNEFLAILSHELRNPLAVIHNSLTILDRVSLDGKQAEGAMGIINRQVGHLTRLVEDLLDVTRINQNKIKLQRRRLELNALVKRTMEDHRLLFEKNGVFLTGGFDTAFVFVNADEARLVQVVGNLLLNAAKFTHRDGSTSVFVEKDALQQKAMIRIVDTGIGMEPEMVLHLFQPFMQVDTSLDRSFGGLGLGLAFSKRIIAMHGGDIGAYSAGLGEGSEFVVCLPLDDIVK